jgi:hypothetical protein
VGGCAASGTAQIAVRGISLCVFDGAVVASDYVQPSSTSFGECHDAGNAYPTGGQVLGRVLQSNASAGTYSVDLYSAGIVPPTQGSACSNKVVTALNNASGPTCTTVTSSYVDSSIAATSGGTANTVPKYTAGSSLGNSSITDDGTSVGLTEQVKLKRISVANGTAQTSTNFVLGTQWGTSPSVGSIVGTDQALQFVVTSGTGSPTTGATVTITFADGSWGNAPICIEKNEASGGTLLTLKNVTTASTLTLTATTAPAVTTAYTINVLCFGR